MIIKKIFYSLSVILILSGLFKNELLPNARHFAYTYETAVLPEDAMEIEAWHTEKIGRDKFYRAIDQRLELEWGITNRMQAAYYFNYSSEQFEDTGGNFEKSNKLLGSSLELKYKLFDATNDPAGFALYGEISSKPHEIEAEAKLLFDKKIGGILFAMNFVGEREWEFKQGKNEYVDAYEIGLGIAYFMAKNSSLGIELLNKNEKKENEPVEKSDLFGGPSFSYSANRWWMASGFLIKLKEIKNSNENNHDVKNEKFSARFLFGFHI